MSSITLSINDLDIGLSKYNIEEIDGLGVPDIRTSQFTLSGRSGGLVTDQFYGMRLITVNGIIKSTDCDTHVLDRQNLEEALPIGETFPVYITLFNGDEYVIYANISDLNMVYQPGGKMSDYKIDLIAGDPLFYSTDAGEIQTASIDRVEQGGYVTPYILPVSWDSGSAPTIVNNSGSEIAYPVITLSDSAANPVLTNQATGEIFGLDINMVDGDEVIIDMGNRTVTLNGANIINNMTSDSTWFALAVGDNPLTLDSDSGSDNISGLIEWRNGVRGI